MEIITFKKIGKLGLPVTFWVLEAFSKHGSGMHRKSFTITLDGYLSKKAYEMPEPVSVETLSFEAYGDHYDTYFSQKALLEAASKGKTIYDVIYDYIIFRDPDLTNVCELPCNNGETCTSCTYINK